MARNYKQLFDVDWPSVTQILQVYPKGQGFYNWLMEKGKDESERIKTEAGTIGHNIHDTIERMLKGEEVDTTYLTNKEEELIEVFMNWWNNLKKEHKVKIIHIEKPVINKVDKYVVTIDLVISIDKQLWIIDIKSSNYISSTFSLQLSAYKHAYIQTLKNTFEYVKSNLKEGIVLQSINPKLAIFHLKSNTFIEVEDEFETFLAVKKVWEFENKNQMNF